MKVRKKVAYLKPNTVTLIQHQIQRYMEVYKQVAYLNFDSAILLKESRLYSPN